VHASARAKPDLQKHSSEDQEGGGDIRDARKEYFTRGPFQVPGFKHDTVMCHLSGDEEGGENEGERRQGAADE
jgi:hypothetical protein